MLLRTRVLPSRSALILPAAGLVLAAAVTFPALAEVPPRTYVGQTLEVPEAAFERGQVFYVLPGQDSQLAIESATSLQRTLATTSRAVGYVVGTFDPEDSERPILGGALRVPVASLDTGSPAVDAQLRGADYLDASGHPEITFELTGTDHVVQLASDDENVFPYRVKLLGKLSARGVTRDVEVEAEVRFLLTTFTTFTRTVGDLVTIAASFDVDASSFGWKPPRGAEALMAATLSVDLFLVASTTSPEKSLDPNLDLERWHSEQRYLTLARDLGDSEAAAEHGRAHFDKYRDNAAALASLARTILDDPGLAERDLALVRKLADRAAEVDGADETVAETSARLSAFLGQSPSPDG